METNRPFWRTRTSSALFAAVLMAGVAAGLGIFTFSYAEGLSYFSSDPQSCINCHAMQDQWDGWNHSSHRNVATCNDCHTPHRFPDKWIVKGINGWNHSLAFTTGNYPDPIQIRAFNSAIAEENCKECHQPMVSMIQHFDTAGYAHASFDSAQEMSCVRCHGNVGHGNARN
jgi:cytochrome c nitrite reductase small subunit